MSSNQFYEISGKEEGIRLESIKLEDKIQSAVENGHRSLEINAFGQHGIGGRLWKAADEKINIKITGHPGQRIGSMGFPNTTIEVMGPASDDVGWLNTGAEITIHGNATNGVANAMAQGKVYVGGNLGSRCMTMTKRNPSFDPPELWVLGSVGDFFGEFMAGGIAVICGVSPQTPDNVLGYKPLVGMVGGKVFVRGPFNGYSKSDAKLIPLEDEDWNWLTENIQVYLEKINRPELLEKLTDRSKWQLIRSLSPQEKITVSRRTISDFRINVWDKELGNGGLIGDLTTADRSQVPLITTGNLRRSVPVWENKKYMAPCEASCPTGIPVQQRWSLIRDGLFEEAVDMSLEYTPFPSTVCGYLCPNLCMGGCTRNKSLMKPVDVKMLGKSSVTAKTPDFPKPDDRKIAIIGGGPAGISVAWQLKLAGHDATIYDASEQLGGKISKMIPKSRIPEDVLLAEINRVNDVIPHKHVEDDLTIEDINRLKKENDFVVFATGAQKPRMIPVPGKERLISTNEFLVRAKADDITPGKHVVIIGAGNVGCDVATEAHRLGSEKITLIDVQEPAAFGIERDEAEEVGAKFMWPCFTKEITEEGVLLTSGKTLKADTVVISIGDVPDISFVPESVEIERGFIKVDRNFKTSDKKIFAIGDIVKPGLLTDSIGAGRVAANRITEILAGKESEISEVKKIDINRVSLEYYNPRLDAFDDINHCGDDCASCGSCRDCGICVQACPQTAIARVDKGKDFEYTVDDNKCIACGFCAGACPCGIWDLVPNKPLG
ncbi:MAG: FAD-dependent oxidoreductase [Desulfobacterales bacterium]|nr:FAD-dependent oxidoreductase [Desulfobacterales bacterium]MCP4163273.1 FAD-dependent oxidoreductase [Deltaproteobacteria bacterium]